MSKINVNGPEMHNVYRYLKRNTDEQPIDWNFAKYLINKKGDAIHYNSGWNPLDLEDEIKNMLKE